MRTAETTQLATRAPLKILLIDNDESLGELFKAVCKDYARDVLEGYHVRRGGLVLSFLLTTPVDIILVDLGLPDVDGVTVIKEIRKNERLYDFPMSKIVVYTGYPITETSEGQRIREMLKTEDVARYVTKPYDLSLLVKEVIGG